MSGHVSKAGQRVDKFAVDDTPHEKYYDCGMPVLLSTAHGKVVKKSVYAYTVSCPECDDVDGYYDVDSEAVCPNCGVLLCDGVDLDMTTSDGQEVIADGPAAGRTSQPNTDSGH